MDRTDRRMFTFPNIHNTVNLMTIRKPAGSQIPARRALWLSGYLICGTDLMRPIHTCSALARASVYGSNATSSLHSCHPSSHNSIGIAVLNGEGATDLEGET